MGLSLFWSVNLCNLFPDTGRDRATCVWERLARAEIQRGCDLEAGKLGGTSLPDIPEVRRVGWSRKEGTSRLPASEVGKGSCSHPAPSRSCEGTSRPSGGRDSGRSESWEVGMMDVNMSLQIIPFGGQGPTWPSGPDWTCHGDAGIVYNKLNSKSRVLSNAVMSPCENGEDAENVPHSSLRNLRTTVRN